LLYFMYDFVFITDYLYFSVEKSDHPIEIKSLSNSAEDNGRALFPPVIR